MLVAPPAPYDLANEPKRLLFHIAPCGREGCDSKMRATTTPWRQTPRTRRANYRRSATTTRSTLAT